MWSLRGRDYRTSIFLIPKQDRRVRVFHLLACVRVVCFWENDSGHVVISSSWAYCRAISRSSTILRMLMSAYRMRPNAVLMLTLVRLEISLKLMSA